MSTKNSLPKNQQNNNLAEHIGKMESAIIEQAERSKTPCQFVECIQAQVTALSITILLANKAGYGSLIDDTLLDTEPLDYAAIVNGTGVAKSDADKQFRAARLQELIDEELGGQAPPPMSRNLIDLTHLRAKISEQITEGIAMFNRGEA